MRYWIATSIALALCTAAAAEDTSDELLGRYWLPEKDGQVEIYWTGSAYNGRVVSYEEPDQLDEKNPDPELRTRKFVGIDMFEAFQFEPDDERWAGGTIYDARAGRIYSCHLWFEDGDRSVLWARGYIGTPWIGRTERFERVQHEELAEHVE